ncbi:tyrosine-type recombinase/integrase [Microvirga pudoricolor]|uniref:tyrosine-type recombinase/integrase n=1 Tax=Microvirga pudoricolor TaxID=2778729 RepID=UPI0019508269|nr:site-specific integrase [Microvirga pudoricolor]MBM6593722.1 integrase arm-type DNA-binding domain-containing protein [Microvirga pudoricolor]
MAKAAIKITKRSVDAAEPESARYELWDTDLKGFGLRVEPTGIKTFIARYRAGAGGRTAPKRFVTLGRYGALTPDDARRKAKEVLGAAARGEDPADAKAKERAAASLSELAEAFLASHVRKKRKAKTVENYENAINNYILPNLGRKKAKLVARLDLSRLHGDLSDKPAIANQIIAVASSMFSWGSRHSFVPEGFNPASKIERYDERRRERFLSTDEIERIGEALREAETIGLPWEPDPDKPQSRAKHSPKSENRRVKFGKETVAAIRLLLLTGARLREILHLRWDYVDSERGLLLLPDSKTGRKTIILNAPALLILEGLERVSDYVIPGDKPGKPRSDLKRPWAAVSTRSGLKGVRLHDLRHTHASFGAGSGMGLPIIGKLLGHTQSATTARYAHLDADPLRRASNKIGGAIAAALEGRPNGPAMPIEGKTKQLGESD